MRRVYRLQDRAFRPWKNGGGTTAEILAAPAGAGFGDFDWRVSTAVVASDGPFSIFPGVDRVLCVIEGGALDLVVAGQGTRLDAESAPFAFAGDVPCTARVTGGPVLDFNVMTRRPLRPEVTRGPLTARTGGLARLALLLEPCARLERLDLVDLGACDPALSEALTGARALQVTIRG